MNLTEYKGKRMRNKASLANIMKDDAYAPLFCGYWVYVPFPLLPLARAHYPLIGLLRGSKDGTYLFKTS